MQIKVDIQFTSLDWPNKTNELLCANAIKEEGKESRVIPIETGGEHWASFVTNQVNIKGNNKRSFNSVYI